MKWLSAASVLCTLIIVGLPWLNERRTLDLTERALAIKEREVTVLLVPPAETPLPKRGMRGEY